VEWWVFVKAKSRTAQGGFAQLYIQDTHLKPRHLVIAGKKMAVISPGGYKNISDPFK